MNRLITFEGIEGCGKTTQISLAGKYLAARGVPLTMSEEPGGTTLGRKIREILLNRGSHAICPEAELLLFAAARAQHVRDVIIPALNEGRWVVCDRFFDATLVYQGSGRGLDLNFIKALHDFSSASLMPAMTVLLDLPVQEGLQRAMSRASRIESRGSLPEDRFEREELDFHRKIREGYLRLAKEEPHRYRVIDAGRDISTVHGEVCKHLDGLMER